MLWLIVACGFVALIGMAIGLGMSLDTEAQRGARRRVAEERRTWASSGEGDGPELPPCSDCPRRPR